MRLINARTLDLEESWDEKAQKYAIISHRWEGEEVSFQNIQHHTAASHMRGFDKIRRSCQQAISDGYEYVWVDTCCINKDSSAELTEAINSMYRWYKASSVCYAYLCDVSATGSIEDVEGQIKSSVWFTRGWTLQELLAPRHLVFYDQNWNFLGTKQTLSEPLTLRTGIDQNILNGEALSNRSIAQRMYWASRRTTTRVEDMAYCLMGIFDVNMPMLYGEGEKAFFRLQAEIIRQSHDHTIFAWPITIEGQPGLLAESPAAFAECSRVHTMRSRKGQSPYSLTNRGLSIKCLATPFSVDTYIARLDCADGDISVNQITADEPRPGIFLRRLHEDDQFARVKCEGSTFMQLKASTWDRKPTTSRRNPRPVEALEINVPQELVESNARH